MIELKPETEELAREEIRRGHFHSGDELIVPGVHALREKRQKERISAPASQPRKNLAGFLLAWQLTVLRILRIVRMNVLPSNHGA